MRTPLWVRGSGCVLVLACVMVAQAQDAPEEPAEPLSPAAAPRTTHPDGIAPNRRPAARKAPAPSAIPGLEDADFRIGAAGLRAEGTFLVQQRGSMVKAATGERIFVFQRDEARRRERPMVLVPCLRLAQMEQIAADRAEPPVFEVTGQVFAYKGVNYLLPTAARTVAPQTPAAGPAPKETRASPKASPPPEEAPSASDPDVASLISELQRQRDEHRGPRREQEPPTAREPDEREEAVATPLEGQMIVRRRGRLVRQPAGEWAFVFDSGPEQEPGPDRPLIVVPCLSLQRMESLFGQKGEAAVFELSGRLLSYQGRGYIVPTMHRAYPPGDLKPRQ